MCLVALYHIQSQPMKQLLIGLKVVGFILTHHDCTQLIAVVMSRVTYNLHVIRIQPRHRCSKKLQVIPANTQLDVSRQRIDERIWKCRELVVAQVQALQVQGIRLLYDISEVLDIVER